MYIKRDLAPVRLLTFFSNRRIWSLFQKAWTKDATGYLNRMYYYQGGAVVDTDNFNRFIRAIGISRSDLTDIDFEGIESAWFEINLPQVITTLTELQSFLDTKPIGFQYTMNFNVGYNSEYLDLFTTNGIIDTEAVVDDVFINPITNINNNNITFYDSDFIDAYLFLGGVGYNELSRQSYTLAAKDFSGTLVKASVTFEKTSESIATQQMVDILNGVEPIVIEQNVIENLVSSYRDNYIWTFSEFNSLKKQEFVDLFRTNFSTDYKEEDASFLEIIIGFIILIISVVLAIPSGGLSLKAGLAVWATFLGAISLYISLAMFIILKTVGMGAIGLIRIFGKIVEILGIATAILGIYAMIQTGLQKIMEQGFMSIVKSALKVFNTYAKFFGQDEEPEDGAKDTTKENQDMIDHANELMFTKSFETTEIEEHYQLMFDIDRYIHV